MKMYCLLAWMLFFTEIYCNAQNNSFAYHAGTVECDLAPAKKANAYATNELLRILTDRGNSATNNYIMHGEKAKVVLEHLHKLQEIYFFDSTGQKLHLGETGSCINYTVSIPNTDLRGKWTDSLTLANVQSWIQPFDANQRAIRHSTYYAVIFYTITTGTKTGDNFFQWESLLKKKFGDTIEILKVNMDASADWQPVYQTAQLHMLQGILDYIN